MCGSARRGLSLIHIWCAGEDLYRAGHGGCGGSIRSCPDADCDRYQMCIRDRYGAHIFHTSDKKVWDYVNKLTEFNNYINSPVAVYKDELYNLPFNMNTFSRLWNLRTPKEVQAKIQEQIADLHITEPKNLEEQALSLVGTDVYEKLIKGYTEKQWGRDRCV